MKSNKVWEIFKNHFESNDHSQYESKDVIPKNDKSLLFVVAGVVPLKKYLLGSADKNEISDKLFSIQPSIRVNDLENVGVTSSHLSMFEMLGFFSIGNYYKRKAAKLIIDFIKKLGINMDVIYLTIHDKDEEMKEILLDMNIDEKKIIKMESNFWDLGSGPCGQSLEVFVDRGKKYGVKNTPNDIKDDIENDRFVEIFNVVFSSFNHVGNKYIELKSKNIDSGGGFERIVTFLQDKDSSFETDLFSSAIEHLKKSSTSFSKRESKVIVDHLRSAIFMISAGVYPGAKNRQFILRKLIRKVVLYLIMFEVSNIQKVVQELCIFLIKPIENRYPNISKNIMKIIEVIKEETIVSKESFDEQIEVLNDYLNNNKKSILNGGELFTLHESRGVDLELMKSILKQKNLEFPEKDYYISEKKHKNVSKNIKIESGFSKSILVSKKKKTVFVGYDNLSITSNLLDKIKDGEYTWLVFDKTPFYPEGGGQTFDKGTITDLDNNIKYEVVDVVKNNDIIFHKIKKVNKKFVEAKLVVTKNIRNKVEQNHSATHILHLAIRKILNDALQSGSSKNEERLRLDFTSSKKFERTSFKKQVEELVNKMIEEDIKVSYEKMTSILEAEKKGYLLTFLEDYSSHSELRGVVIGESKELCIGTHVKSTSQIKKFVIKNFKTKGKNTYRIEALTGDNAINFENSKTAKDTSKNTNKKSNSLDLNINTEIDKIKLYQKQGLKVGFLHLKDNFDRNSILELCDKVIDMKEANIFIVVFGNNNSFISVSTKSFSDTYQTIMKELINSNIIIGGLKESKMMGKLKTPLVELTNYLKRNN